MREAPNCAEHLLHCRCLADDLGGRDLRSRRFSTAHFLCVGDRALDHGNRIIDIEGLRQIFECTASVARHCSVEIGVRGHDDDRHSRAFALHALEQLQAIHPRHADVADDDRRRLYVELAQCCCGALEALRCEANFGECTFEHPADGAVVIDHPYFLGTAGVGVHCMSLTGHSLRARAPLAG